MLSWSWKLKLCENIRVKETPRYDLHHVSVDMASQADMISDQSDTAELDAALLDLLASNLSPPAHEGLETLSQLPSLLNTANAKPTSLAHALIALTQHSHAQSQQADHLASLLTALQHAHTATVSELTTIRNSPAFAPPPPSHARRAADYARQTKHLRAKLREYENRLAGLPDPMAAIGVGSMRGRATARSVKAREEEVRALRERVHALEGELEAFGGLPGDRDGARKKVLERQRELEALRERRDRAFEGLVER
jgi:HAUS augmin-like complex subunit 1